MAASTTEDKTEALTSNEVISSLWSPAAIEKCRIGLADVVVFENGYPVRYYITGSTGEVKLKRNVDMNAISKRWLNIAEQFESSYVAVIRQHGEIFKYLTVDAWKAFILEPRQDRDIQSLHSFLSSGTHNVLYRSYYHMNLTTHRWRMNTKTFSIPIQDPLHVSYGHALQLVDSKAVDINKVMDLATTTVVRYVEKMLKINIKEFVVDYVIDKQARIWMLWSLKALFERVERLPSRGKDKGTTSTSPQTSPTENATMTQNSSDQIQEEEVAIGLTQQLSSMAQISSSRKDPSASQLSTVTSTHLFTATPDRGNTPSNKSRFPQSNACRGDYCHLEVRPVGVLAPDKAASKHIANLLFTEDELFRLKKDSLYEKMMDFGDTPKGVVEINMKSIEAARRDKRLLMKVDEKNSLLWKTFPDAKPVEISKSTNIVERLTAPKTNTVRALMVNHRFALFFHRLGS